jgi:beta-mannosidase
VWFYKDLWPAAGWGIVDSTGTPKAAYYQLKRAWQTRQLTLTDEGLDGLHVHLSNETAEAVEGFVEVQLLREPNVVVARHEIALKVGGRSLEMRSVDEILGSFFDVNFAYRFGPQSHHVVIATWFSAEREVISESFHLTRARDPVAQPFSAEMLDAKVGALVDGRYLLTLKSDRFVHNVRLSAKGFLPDDNYFHLAPNRLKTVSFSPRSGGSKVPEVYVEALNVAGEISVEPRSASHETHHDT